MYLYSVQIWIHSQFVVLLISPNYHCLKICRSWTQHANDVKVSTWQLGLEERLIDSLLNSRKSKWEDWLLLQYRNQASLLLLHAAGKLVNDWAGLGWNSSSSSCCCKKWMQQSCWREGGLIDQLMKNPAIMSDSVLGMVKELFIQMGYIAMGW